MGESKGYKGECQSPLMGTQNFWQFPTSKHQMSRSMLPLSYGLSLNAFLMFAHVVLYQAFVTMKFIITV